MRDSLIRAGERPTPEDVALREALREHGGGDVMTNAAFEDTYYRVLAAERRRRHLAATLGD